MQNCAKIISYLVFITGIVRKKNKNGINQKKRSLMRKFNIIIYEKSF